MQFAKARAAINVGLGGTDRSCVEVVSMVPGADLASKDFGYVFVDRRSMSRAGQSQQRRS